MVVQADDRETREFHGAPFRGRGRGGRGGGFAVRGLAAAGLTRQHDKRPNGDPAGSASESGEAKKSDGA